MDALIVRNQEPIAVRTHGQPEIVALEALRATARSTGNTMPSILDCVRTYATLGEIMGVLREEFGEYREPAIL